VFIRGEVLLFRLRAITAITAIPAISSPFISGKVEPLCGRLSPQAKSRAQRAISISDYVDVGDFSDGPISR